MKYFGLLFLALLLCPLSADAQQIKIFEDDLGVKGEIRYYGTWSDSLLPKQGAIDLRWRETGVSGLKTWRVKGQTRDHLPTGRWSWEEADWEYSIRVGESIRPVFNAKGRRMRWEGNFVNGKPDGRWDFVLDSISEKGIPFGTLLRVEINYKNGIPSGTFSIRQADMELRLSGTCDAEGIASGTWVYQYKTPYGTNVKEERIYKKGLLAEVQITEDKERSTVKFEHNLRFLEKAHDTTLFEARRIGEQRFEEDQYRSRASVLLRHNLQGYFTQGWRLEVLPVEALLVLPEFRKLEYPLTAAEKEAISASRAQISIQRDSIESQLSGNIYIHRARSGELDTTISFLQLNLERLNYIDSLLELTDYPLFTYTNRAAQDLSYWFDGLNDLRYARGEVYDSLMVEFPLLPFDSDSITAIEALNNELHRNAQLLPPYYSVMQEVHLVLKRQGELELLENIIVDRFQEVQAFYAEKEGIAAEINTRWVKGEVQKMIQEYARTDQYEEALQKGYQIMHRLDSLESWQEKLEIFDRMPEVLRAQYTYLAYNPYTGENDIPITVKKRFLNDVLLRMWPYMGSELAQEYDWDKWAALWQQQFEVHQYLMAFASKEDAAARRLQRRVRKDKKPEKMLRHILQQIERH